MILDSLSNASRYAGLNPGFPKAFEFLSRSDLADLPPDRYEIDGTRVYAMIAKEAGRKKEDAQLEIHQEYIDIQLVLGGVDQMGWKLTSACERSAGPYNAEQDLRFFEDAPDFWFPVGAGTFAIFYPEDAHLPMISDEEIHKVVVKIAVE